MATTAQIFYLSTNAKDFTAAGEVDIRRLVATAVTVDSTTICSHPSAAGTTQITLDPYSTSSTQSDIRTNLGWAINRAGSTDAMDSTSSVERIIPAGTWTFTLGLGLPTAGTGTGTLTGSFLVAVYRVSSTGARTLLFTATSGTGGSTGLAVFSGTLTATSASQPQITLLPNETIHVGYLSNVVQVAGVAGATVAGKATWTLGSSPYFVQVAGVGVRSLYLDSVRLVTMVGLATKGNLKVFRAIPSVTSVGVVAIKKKIIKLKFLATMVGIAAIKKFIKKIPMLSTMVGLATKGKLTVFRKNKVTMIGVAARGVTKITKFPFKVTMVGVVSFAKKTTAARRFIVTMVGVAAFARRLTSVRKFKVIMTGVAKSLLRISTDILNRVTGGGGSITYVTKKVITFLFDE